MLSRQIASRLRGYETPFYLYDTALLRQTLESVVYESNKYGYKVHSQLMVEEGKRHQCTYDTGCGTIILGVSGSRIAADLDEQGGTLEFHYSLDVNTALVSENDVYVAVFPR